MQEFIKDVLSQQEYSLFESLLPDPLVLNTVVVQQDHYYKFYNFVYRPIILILKQCIGLQRNDAMTIISYSLNLFLNKLQQDYHFDNATITSLKNTYDHIVKNNQITYSEFNLKFSPTIAIPMCLDCDFIHNNPYKYMKDAFSEEVCSSFADDVSDFLNSRGYYVFYDLMLFSYYDSLFHFKSNKDYRDYNLMFANRILENCKNIETFDTELTNLYLDYVQKLDFSFKDYTMDIKLSF